MNHPYIDLHTHTCLSDGNLPPRGAFDRKLSGPLLEVLG